MHPRHPLHDVIPKIALYARSLRLWAMELVVWWVGIFGDRAAKLNVRREIRDLARMTRILLLLAVAARLRFPARKRDIRRPFGAPRGCRYRWRRIRFARALTRGVRLKTLADIRDVLDHLDAHAARCFARAPKTFVGAALVTHGVVDDVRAPMCAAFGTLAPDTS